MDTKPVATAKVPPAPPPAPPAKPPEPSAPAAPVLAGDQVAALPAKGPVPSPDQAGISLEPEDKPLSPWRRIDLARTGIVLGMAPLGYVGGLFLHEGVGHGGMVALQGGKVTGIHMLPATHIRADGSTGIRFGYMTYDEGADWGKKERTLVSLGPSLLDVGIMAGTTALYETGNWPESPWLAAPLLVLHGAAMVDLGNAALGGILHPGDKTHDTVKAAHGLGIHPRTLGVIEGVATAGAAVEFVRMAWDTVKKPETSKPSIRPDFGRTALGTPTIGLKGEF